MLKGIGGIIIASSFFVFQGAANGSPSFNGEYSYLKRIGSLEIGGGLTVSSSPKSGPQAKYRARFNGYYARNGMPSICDFEADLVAVTPNVFSMKNGSDDDFRFNLVLVFEGSELTIFSTDKIEGCGLNAEHSVPGKYKRTK